MATIKITNPATNVVYATNNKGYFARISEGKTTRISADEYAKAKAEIEALSAPKTPATPKKESKSTTESIGNYTLITDGRGRMSFKQLGTKAILVMVQPAKTHYTVYVSKNVVQTPEDALTKLAQFNVEAVVNPTYKKKPQSDPFSVKATLRDATRDQLTSVVDALLA